MVYANIFTSTVCRTYLKSRAGFLALRISSIMVRLVKRPRIKRSLGLHGRFRSLMKAPEQHRSYAPTTLGFALVTVSDSRVASNDGSGQLLKELILGVQHEVIRSTIVPDDVEAIRSISLENLRSQQVDVVVLAGGTGLAPRDMTVEAVEPLFERRIEGFGELFRMLSYKKIGPAAMLSRAVAGVTGRKAVFALPGSPAAVRLAMEELILPEAAHLIGQLRRE